MLYRKLPIVNGEEHKESLYFFRPNEDPWTHPNLLYHPMGSDDAKGKEILDKGAATLRSLDESFAVSNHDTREFPHFQPAEIYIGAGLGMGGFSTVHEIDRIKILASTPEGATDNPEDSDSDVDLAAKGGHVEHHDHYDVGTAREFMSQHYNRNGSARYAIKKLRPDLDELDRVRGAVDLAIEITMLSTIWHPNISK
jgi:hypothetical protein